MTRITVWNNADPGNEVEAQVEVCCDHPESDGSVLENCEVCCTDGFCNCPAGCPCHRAGVVA